MKNALLFLLLGLSVGVEGQVDTIYWQKKTPMPDSMNRGDFGYFLIDSNIYIFGGFDYGSNYYKDVWKYNIPTDQWRQMGNLPEPASIAANFVINGKGYMLTARDSINNYECDSAFFEYDPSTDLWTRKANLSNSHRQAAVGFSYNGIGYIGLGGGCSGYYNDFWKYDALTNFWAQSGNLPSAQTIGRSGSIAVTADSFSYLTGGVNPFASFNDLWQYNFTNNTWDSMGGMPGPDRNVPLLWGFNELLLGGGGDSKDSLGNVYIDTDFYSYDISQNSWSPVKFINFIDSIAGGAPFTLGKSGYYYGGLRSLTSGPSFSRDMWSFDASPILKPDSVKNGINGITSSSIKLYPNPVRADQNFQIVTPSAGQVAFYNSLGQLLFSSNLNTDTNRFNAAQLNDDADVVFYRAVMGNGGAVNGRMVVIR